MHTEHVNDPNAPQFVYCDTDSVKYLGEIDLSKFNAERIKDSKRSGAYATDPKGITHYMGVYEKELICVNFVQWVQRNMSLEKHQTINLFVQ